MSSTSCLEDNLLLAGRRANSRRCNLVSQKMIGALSRIDSISKRQPSFYADTFLRVVDCDQGRSRGSLFHLVCCDNVLWESTTDCFTNWHKGSHQDNAASHSIHGSRSTTQAGFDGVRTSSMSHFEKTWIFKTDQVYADEVKPLLASMRHEINTEYGSDREIRDCRGRRDLC